MMLLKKYPIFFHSSNKGLELNSFFLSIDGVIEEKKTRALAKALTAMNVKKWTTRRIVRKIHVEKMGNNFFGPLTL